MLKWLKKKTFYNANRLLSLVSLLLFGAAVDDEFVDPVVGVVVEGRFSAAAARSAKNLSNSLLVTDSSFPDAVWEIF